MPTMTKYGTIIGIGKSYFTNPSNVTDTDEGTYGSLTTVKSGNRDFLIRGYDFSKIASGATINSITLKLKAGTDANVTLYFWHSLYYNNGTSVEHRGSSPHAQIEAAGNLQTITLNDQTYFGTWTRNDLCGGVNSGIGFYFRVACGNASGKKIHVYYTKVTVNYTGKETLDEEKCELYSQTVTYNGKQRTPVVRVRNYAGTLLTNNTDYTYVTPSGRTNVGTYNYVITGKGNYTGTITEVFTINPQPLVASRVSFSEDSVIYDGQAHSPTITVTNSAGTTLVQGTDYTVTAPSGRINPGTYTYTITGIGNYTGTITKDFIINPAISSISLTPNPANTGQGLVITVNFN